MEIEVNMDGDNFVSVWEETEFLLDVVVWISDIYRSRVLVDTARREVTYL